MRTTARFGKPRGAETRTSAGLVGRRPRVGGQREGVAVLRIGSLGMALTGARPTMVADGWTAVAEEC